MEMLTEHESKTYAYIKECLLANRASDISVMKVCEEVGLDNPSMADYLVRCLLEKGVITKSKRSWSSMQLTDKFGMMSKSAKINRCIDLAQTISNTSNQFLVRDKANELADILSSMKDLERL